MQVKQSTNNSSYGSQPNTQHVVEPHYHKHFKMDSVQYTEVDIHGCMLRMDVKFSPF